MRATAPRCREETEAPLAIRVCKDMMYSQLCEGTSTHLRVCVGMENTVALRRGVQKHHSCVYVHQSVCSGVCVCG